MNKYLKNEYLLTNILSYLELDEILVFFTFNKDIAGKINPETNPIINNLFYQYASNKLYKFDHDNESDKGKEAKEANRKDIFKTCLKKGTNWRLFLSKANHDMICYPDKTIAKRVLNCFKIHLFLPDLRKENHHLEFDHSTSHMIFCYDKKFRDSCSSNFYSKYINENYINKHGNECVVNILREGTIKKGLLLTGNTQSRNLNYNDKSTWPLFGDAGSATAIEYSPEGGDLFQLYFMNDGSGEKTIVIPDGGYRNMVNPDSFVEHEYEGGIKRNNLNLFMQGDDVYAFVISNVPKASRAMFEHFGVEQDHIDYYLIHHASRLIIKKLLKKLDIPESKAPIQLKSFGNSSNVSIPLLMSTSIKEEVLNKKLNLYISGFGVGLSLGVGIISVGALECADLIEM